MSYSRRILATGFCMALPMIADYALAGEWSGLPPGPGREDVFVTCQICHSLKIVQQQGLSRSSWDETLTWMVEEQGMPEPVTEKRERILDYLATHFGRGG